MTEDTDIILAALKYVRNDLAETIWAGLTPPARIRLARLNAEIARRIPHADERLAE